MDTSTRSNPFSLFEKIFVINLPERKDRWDQAKAELAKYNIDNFIRFPAIKNEVGALGCALSHLSLLEQMRKEKVKTFLILEDDFTLLNKPLETLANATGQLPEDWDMLYLGATTYSPLKRYSKNLFHLNEAFATHAIAYNNRKSGLLDYILSHQSEITIIDIFYRENLQKNFKCFIPYPLICSQRNSFSNITSKVEKMNWIESRFWKNTRGSLSLQEKIHHWLEKLQKLTHRKSE